MKTKPQSIIYKIELDEEESEIFQRKLPSDSSIEMFVEAIGENNCTMEIDIYERGSVITVSLDYTQDMFFSDIKAEIKRIESEIQIFINEP